MSLVINTNIASLNAQRQLTNSQSALQTSMERLSSGLRINSAKDDAAGLAISQGMTSQINGMNQAARNANDAISLSQTAEGNLSEIGNILQTMRTLAVQAANDTNSSSNRSTLGNEMTALTAEIDRIAGSANFNGTQLLSTSTSLTFQVGAGTTANDKIAVSTVNATASTLGITSLSVADNSSADAAITSIDNAITQVNNGRAAFGVVQNRFTSVISNLQTSAQNLSAAQSRIQDADFAAETANLTKNQILQQAGMAMLSQANQMPNQVMTLLR